MHVSFSFYKTNILKFLIHSVYQFVSYEIIKSNIYSILFVKHTGFQREHLVYNVSYGFTTFLLNLDKVVTAVIYN